MSAPHDRRHPQPLSQLRPAHGAFGYALGHTLGRGVQALVSMLVVSFGVPAAIAFMMNSVAAQEPLLATKSTVATSPLDVPPSFRVETDVYEGEDTAPQNQRLILFDAGVVYDLPVAMGSTITVFDAPRGRVVLLHKTSRVKASIATDTLVQMTAQLRAEIEARGDTASKLGLNAKVMQGDQPDRLSVAFGESRYDATTQPVNNPRIATEFAAFAGWAARLNIAQHIGSPPFARMTLDEQIAAERQIPKQVRLTVRRAFKTRSFRSEHLLVERLSDMDRKRISDVGGMMATYADVDFADFPTE